MVIVYQPTKQELQNFIDTISESVIVGLMNSQIPSDKYTIDDIVKINKSVVEALIQNYNIDVNNLI